MRLQRFLVLTLAVLSLPCFSQQPATGSEAAVTGLHGPVHTVLTKYFGRYADKPRLSIFSIYDSQGYLLEEYRYADDGSISRHTKYTRDGSKILKLETTSIVPSENRTFIQSFNSDGLVSGTETYDGSGVLIEKTKTDFLPNGGGVNSQTVKSNGAVSTDNTVENTDPATGITHQTVMKDGKSHSDWLIRRDKRGKPVADRLTLSDGSFNESEVRDGLTVEHRYWAPTKLHTYQTTDSNNHVLEVIDESPGYYTKTKYRYDKAGNQTELANYDRSGKLLRKTITDYQEDGNGNWIEQKEFHRDSNLGSKPPMPGDVTRRFITYY